MSALAARSEQADVLAAAADEFGQVCLVRAGVDGVEDGLFEALVGPSGSGKSLLDASDLGEFGHVDQVATDVGTESRPDLFLYGLTHARVTANMVGSSKPRELAATSTLTSANRPNPAGHRAIPSCPKEVAMSDSAEVRQRTKDDVLAAARAVEWQLVRLAEAIAEIEVPDVHFHEFIAAGTAAQKARSDVDQVAKLAVKWGAR